MKKQSRLSWCKSELEVLGSRFQIFWILGLMLNSELSDCRVIGELTCSLSSSRGLGVSLCIASHRFLHIFITKTLIYTQGNIVGHQVSLFAGPTCRTQIPPALLS